MTPLFWSLYVPTIAILFAVSFLVRSLHPIRWWRYRSIRRERAEQLGVEPMDRARLELAVRLGARR